MTLICVIGATGWQGGSVCATLKHNTSWHVRGITRNPSSASAKKLIDQGIEVVHADANDEASLVKAFSGASAIFSNMSFNWAGVAQIGRDEAGEQEKTHQINIAKAAAKTPTLTHFILSSLPPAGVVSGGKFKVPHFDYKYAAYQWMQANLPDLVIKTTVVWLGWYPSNMAYSPSMRFIPVPGSSTYLWLQPSRRDAVLPIAGDVQHNVGVVIQGVLEAGHKAYGKLAVIVTDYLNMEDVVNVWQEVTGERGVYVEVSDEAAMQIWGVAGLEIASQFRWSERYPNWHHIFQDQLITFEELGIKSSIRSFRQGLESVKGSLV